MKVVILAGGLGTRISEESQFRPKPMVELGGMPILLHIMKHFYAYGHDEFIICAGYKQHIIKEYFANYHLHTSDVTFDYRNGKSDIEFHSSDTEQWKISVINTGLNTMTGGRVKRIREYIGNEPFMLTYGDGVSDIDLNKLIEFHKNSSSMITMSAYNAGQRFGVIDIDSKGVVREFREKVQGDGNLINIGFMVCEPEFIDLIDDDSTMLEREPLERAAAMGQLTAYKHNGFWQCMDTVREKELLEKLWNSGNAPWKTW